jgi:glyoxylase-like metal-dependent hydrolase (beta-lactamase superfamily II)
MFGVVPKPLWERRIAPDALNRIPLSLRCLLVEHDDGLVLIDTGVGNKETDKFRGIYNVENAGAVGPTRLEDALADLGFRPADVRWVVNTHLHFDHAGGNTCVDAPSGGPPARLSFPNATYVVQQRELEFAGHANERTAASYLQHNFAPVSAAGRWRLANGESELLPGIRLVPTPGHVPYHQSVVIARGGERACFLADLVPTTAHLPVPWTMGYDLEPLVTIETKRALLSRAEADSWILVFGHDPVHAAGRVVREGKSFAFRALDTPRGPG